MIETNQSLWNKLALDLGKWEQKEGIGMRIEVSHQDKLATVWLARGEREDRAVRERLESLYADCKEKKYMVAVYQSGHRDLLSQTSGLLCHNRRWMAQLAGRGMCR